jgi:hypothetical protein
MPKKLTKAQVRKLFNSAHNAIYRLMLDKISNAQLSHVTMSWKKLGDLDDVMVRARNRVK